MIVYADTSALVKRLVTEEGSELARLSRGRSAGSSGSMTTSS